MGCRKFETYPRAQCLWALHLVMLWTQAPCSRSLPFGCAYAGSCYIDPTNSPLFHGSINDWFRFKVVTGYPWFPRFKFIRTVMRLSAYMYSPWAVWASRRPIDRSPGTSSEDTRELLVSYSTWVHHIRFWVFHDESATYHLQNVFSCTSLDRVSRESIYSTSASNRQGLVVIVGCRPPLYLQDALQDWGACDLWFRREVE